VVATKASSRLRMVVVGVSTAIACPQAGCGQALVDGGSAYIGGGRSERLTGTRFGLENGPCGLPGAYRKPARGLM
jgi:hypothetical protein